MNNFDEIKLGDCVSHTRCKTWKGNIIIRKIYKNNLGDYFIDGDYYWKDGKPSAKDILGTVTCIPLEECTLIS